MSILLILSGLFKRAELSTRKVLHRPRLKFQKLIVVL